MVSEICEETNASKIVYKHIDSFSLCFSTFRNGCCFCCSDLLVWFDVLMQDKTTYSRLIMYDLEVKKWEIKYKPIWNWNIEWPKPRMNAASVLLSNDKALIHGGQNAGWFGLLKDTWLLHLIRNQAKRSVDVNWKHLETTGTEISKRYKHSANLVNGSVYIFGGKDSYDNTLYMLDLSTNVVMAVTASGNFPEGRAGHSMTTFQTSLFLFGGKNASSKMSNEMYEFDTLRSEWTIVSCSAGVAPTLKYPKSLLLEENIFFVFGSSHRSSDSSKHTNLNIFNILEKEWRVASIALSFAKLNKAYAILGSDRCIYLLAATSFFSSQKLIQLEITSDREAKEKAMQRALPEKQVKESSSVVDAPEPIAENPFVVREKGARCCTIM